MSARPDGTTAAGAEPHRVAIYFAPAPDSALAGAAAAWFAGDAAWLEAPRRYGFHATLKAPFRLRDGLTFAALEAALQDFAARMPALSPLRLAPTLLDGFVALVPDAVGDTAALQEAVLRDFEPFRAPLSDAEIARRRASGLTPRQDALLLEFGYPLVLEEFRFHMTLSARLPEAERTGVLARAEAHFGAALAALVPLDRIWLFAEPHPNSAFIAARSFLLGGALAGEDPAALPGKASWSHA